MIRKPLGELKPGDHFVFDGKPYIKTDDYGPGYYQCVMIYTGQLVSLFHHYEVTITGSPYPRGD